MPDTGSMRAGTIFLEGDIKCRIIQYDSIWCVLKYGILNRHITMRRAFMKFRYARRSPSHAVSE